VKNIILHPLITEKNTYRQSDGVYVFECATDASKDDIKKAVESFFKVNVSKVNTSVTRSRAKRTKFGVGKVSYAKKAFVKLRAGQKIAVFEGV
jgi:large subunit ribosomal protein L23